MLGEVKRHVGVVRRKADRLRSAKGHRHADVVAKRQREARNEKTRRTADEQHARAPPAGDRTQDEPKRDGQDDEQAVLQSGEQHIAAKIIDVAGKRRGDGVVEPGDEKHGQVQRHEGRARQTRASPPFLRPVHNFPLADNWASSPEKPVNVHGSASPTRSRHGETHIFVSGTQTWTPTAINGVGATCLDSPPLQARVG